MKTNYVKAIPTLVIELIKILPIIIKYVKPLWEEIKIKYNKEKIEELNKQVDKCLGIGE